jgi:hypothetical protein
VQSGSSPRTSKPQLPGAYLALRATGRAIAIAGVSIPYGSLIVLLVTYHLPPLLLRIAFIMAIVGCLWLVCLLTTPWGSKGKVATEATLGLLSLPPGWKTSLRRTRRKRP